MKYRYQNSNFKKNLEHARHFKRRIKKVPSSSREIFFSKVGLSSVLAKVALVFIVIFLVYMTYASTFLSLTNIEVRGLKLKERAQAMSLTNQYLNKKTLLPEKNYLFFRANGLKKILRDSSVNILSVESIKKNYPNTLEIEIKPRYSKYFVKNQIYAYGIAFDGTIVEKKSANEQLEGNLIPLTFTKIGDWALGQKVISENTAIYLDKISKQLFDETGLKILTFTIDPSEEFDLSVQTQNEYIIKFDLRTEISESLKNLTNLFKQIPLNAKLAYIDLRLPERAYVCYKNTACAILKPEATLGISTSTPENLQIKN